MSHIFDALQRSEFEQSGSDIPAPAVATELLQAAERKAAVERGTVVEREMFPERQAEAEPPSVAEQPRDAAVDQFSQFQSLRVLVPPQGKLVALTEQESLAAEKFRFLGVRLRQVRQSRPLKKVLITSTIPQEGKSMVAANLACTLARRTQQKTLLMDGDLRRPSLAQLFGVGMVPGITEWLQGESGPVSSIYRLEDPGLWILPAGNCHRNPLELMQSGKLPALMDQLSTWFDWIIMDSPPVLPLGDTSIWMRLADGILLVTRQGSTEKQQLQRGLEAIEKSKLIGALLNSAVAANHSDYYQRYAAPSASAQDVPIKSN
ncbi:MAG: CpsD/CapB family tyrosine-protein kinase [Acidobacteriia bacterium]|nr:CpsD/CapB family tyrosine-protein kinase [Terriglobia bacterium]